MHIPQKDSVSYTRDGMEGKYYQLPETNGGTTLAVAKFTAEHGKRTIGEKPRIYYLLEGNAKFQLNDKTFAAMAGDVIVISAGSTYNFWPEKDFVKILLVMELLDLDKLPK